MKSVGSIGAMYYCVKPTLQKTEALQETCLSRDEDQAPYI